MIDPTARWPVPTSLVLIASLIGAASSPSRRDAPNVPLAGVVFDSVNGRPLRGATVEAVDVSAPLSPVHRAPTDSAGRFTIPDLTAGKYLVTFSHPVMDSLGVEVVPRTVDLGRGAGEVVLAVPSLATVGRALCGAEANDSTGIVLGRIYGAETLSPAGDISVALWWNDIVVSRTGVRQRQSKGGVTTTANGRFVFCAVPANTELGLRASSGADSTAVVSLSVKERDASRRDLYVGGVVGASAERAIVRGEVRANRGQLLSGASVRLVGAPHQAIAGPDGRFQLSTPALGTRQIEIRSVGFLPAMRIVDLHRGNLPSLTVELQTIREVMDTLHVRASRVFSANSNGFDTRRNAGGGSFFVADDVQRLHVLRLTDLLRRANGVEVDHTGNGPITLRADFSAGRCAATIFINGVQVPGLDATDLNSMVRPEEITGVEVYTSSMRTPAQFATLNGCGTIVVWSSPR